MKSAPTLVRFFLGLACLGTVNYGSICIARSSLNFSHVGTSIVQGPDGMSPWASVGGTFPDEEPSAQLSEARNTYFAFPLLGLDANYPATGWKSNPWFGKFLPTQNPWTYHASLGWVYLQQESIDSIWIWQDEIGWVWSNANRFPYLYQNDPDGWLALDQQSSQPALLYDFPNQLWFELGRPVFDLLIEINRADGGSVDAPVVFRKGDDIALLARPESGFVFTGWSGFHKTGMNPLILTDLQEPISLTANFEPLNRALHDNLLELGHLQNQSEREQAYLELALFGTSSLLSIGSKNEDTAPFSPLGDLNTRLMMASAESDPLQAEGIFASDSAKLTHRHFPLDQGSRTSILIESDRRKKAELIVDGTDKILDVRTARIRIKTTDEVFERRWMAQDRSGNLWIMRSDSYDHDPFIVLPANPSLDWVSWDNSSLVPMGYSITLGYPAEERAPGYGLVSQCIKVNLHRETSGQIETYAPGIGLISISIPQAK